MENHGLLFIDKLQQLIDFWHCGDVVNAKSTYEDLIKISEASNTDFNKNLDLALVRLQKRCVGMLDSKKVSDYILGVMPSSPIEY